jgi:hypothetical protein
MTADQLSRPILAAALALMLAGCGLTDPYQQRSTTSVPIATAARTRADQTDPAPERGGTIPSPAQAAQTRLTAGASQATPQATLERYAAIYLNWNSTNVIQVQRELASISLGQARAQALQAAANAGHDPQLSGSHISNRGQVIAASPRHGSASGEWVIVTSEQTSGRGDYRGLPPTLHIIYARLERTGRGWVISEWSPQN